MEKHYVEWMNLAYEQAKKSFDEGGLPIGAVLVDGQGRIVSKGHNKRVQEGDPTAHAEMVCIRNAGRRRDWHECTLVSTLSPCVMCTGTSLLLKIPRVVIGENQNYMGAEELFNAHGVEVIHLDDEKCIQLMSTFIEKYPELWNEDIGIVPSDSNNS